MIKNFFKKILPDKIYLSIKYFFIYFRLFSNYYYDMKRYLKYTTTHAAPQTFQQLEARIQAHAHVIEKGLALRNPRLGFGKEIISALLELLFCYKDKDYSIENQSYYSAVNALNDYVTFHENNYYDVAYLRDKLFSLNIITKNEITSYLIFSRDDILRYSKSEFDIFSSYRFSIRDFSEIHVDNKFIKEAIKIAQKSPSVCNRQSSRVYIVGDKKIISKMLNIQNGSRGFGHLAAKFLIVTSEQMAFDGVQERNQGFIDGGIFSMSLIYALHYMGLGTCALNWAVEKERDKEFRKVIPIKESENIILLIAVGHLPERFKVTHSLRKDTSDIIYEY